MSTTSLRVQLQKSNRVTMMIRAYEERISQQTPQSRGMGVPSPKAKKLLFHQQMEQTLAMGDGSKVKKVEQTKEEQEQEQEQEAGTQAEEQVPQQKKNKWLSLSPLCSLLLDILPGVLIAVSIHRLDVPFEWK